MHADTQPAHTRGQFVCVFGISGVGKSTLIEQFVRHHADWRSLAAGELLARAVQRHPEHLRTSSPDVIEANQYALAELIQDIRARKLTTNWLLDAHSLIDNGTELVPVPTAAISRLEPTALRNRSSCRSSLPRGPRRPIAPKTEP